MLLLTLMAAFLPISLRFSGVSREARALPPRLPRKRARVSCGPRCRLVMHHVQSELCEPITISRAARDRGRGDQAVICKTGVAAGIARQGARIIGAEK